MGLFRRKRRDDDVPASPPADPHPALPVLSREDGAALEHLARRAFAEHGVETTSEGLGLLRAIDGQTFGLANLAAKVDRIGGWAAVRAAAIENLLALPPMEHQVVQADPERSDADVHVLTCDDFFGPSPGSASSRRRPACCSSSPTAPCWPSPPVAGPGIVAALQLLARVGVGECEGEPVQQVTRTDADGGIGVRVEGALADAFAALGLTV